MLRIKTNIGKICRTADWSQLQRFTVHYTIELLVIFLSVKAYRRLGQHTNKLVDMILMVVLFMVLQLGLVCCKAAKNGPIS